MKHTALVFSTIFMVLLSNIGHGSFISIGGGGGGGAPAAHVTTHEDGGTDEMNGDLLGAIDTFAPANLTLNITEAGCTATDQLCAWLKGIDVAIGAATGMPVKAPENCFC